MASVTSARMVVWVVADSLVKGVLEFDWHQVARKSLTAGPDSGRNHRHGQHMDFACEETSSADFQNST